MGFYPAVALADADSVQKALDDFIGRKVSDRDTYGASSHISPQTASLMQVTQST